MSRPLSGLSTVPDVSSGDPVMDSAAGAGAVGQDVGLEDGEVGRMVAEPERAAAGCE